MPHNEPASIVACGVGVHVPIADSQTLESEGCAQAEDFVMNGVVAAAHLARPLIGEGLVKFAFESADAPPQSDVATEQERGYRGNDGDDLVGVHDLIIRLACKRVDRVGHLRPGR